MKFNSPAKDPRSWWTIIDSLILGQLDAKLEGHYLAISEDQAFTLFVRERGYTKYDYTGYSEDFHVAQIKPGVFKGYIVIEGKYQLLHPILRELRKLWYAPIIKDSQH